MMNEVSAADPLISFPYQFDAEPTEDWTVEQLTQWVLIQARQKNTVKAHELINRLSHQYDEMKKQVWDLHFEAKQGISISENDKHCDINSMYQEESTSVDCHTVSKSVPVSSSSIESTSNTNQNTPTQLFIEIVSGPYQGSTFVLKPELRKPCFIGRSSGKKFRSNGISLPKNPEVSTTHAKVEVSMDGNGHRKYFYTDTGSTNGTLYKDEELEENVPLEIFHGMELVIGGSLLRFSFLYD